MSLYNVLFGENHYAEFVLATLGLIKDDVGRYRNVFVSDGTIAVYTRNGGGNRQHWEYSYPDMKEGADCPCVGCLMTYRIHKFPYYSHDKDDDFDCTYATIYFSFPDQWKEELSALESGTFNPSAQWHEKIDSIKNTDSTPAMKAIGEKMIKMLKEGKGGIIEV